AILLAGLFAKGETTVVEQAATRDHTENMLKAFGAEITSSGLTHTVTNANTLQATNVTVPGDIYAAVFIIIDAAIVTDSSIVLKNVGINSNRKGIIDVVQKNSANLNMLNEQEISEE